MTNRMYKHMKNTLRDIKTIINDKDYSDDVKILAIQRSIDLLKSVECGEVITSDL